MVKFNDLRIKNQNNSKIFKNVFTRIVDSGWLILGPETKEFEQKFSQYIGTKYAVGVGNGTDAIKLALTSGNIGKTDLVALSANAAMYSTISVLGVGAKPFFLDVDLESRSISHAQVEHAISKGVKAVIVTHLYGMINPEIEAIAETCKKSNVLLIEDCAQAHGSSLRGNKAGSFGDLSTFSFYPTKNLGALGDGGAVLTSNSELSERLFALRQYGWKKKYFVEMEHGFNTRLDEIQAAFLNLLLDNLDRDNERRRFIAKKYINGITPGVLQLPTVVNENHVYHLFVVRSERRNDLQEFLFTKEIQTDIHYPLPDHKQPIFKNIYAGLELRNTDLLSETVLSLPCYPELRDDEVDEVISAINSWKS